ncbi:hypothetical protein QR680_004044 [Steinernema hermaphroditum]|uniref:Uncharacterized protein n=1 Tax=Steinernema hermaphroditum TaxID=289476 RepID=A0AA39HMG9_9BILA|nr:hypothetical protein QR680_004044 [Steinernema hermaphroditum]
MWITSPVGRSPLTAKALNIPRAGESNTSVSSRSVREASSAPSEPLPPFYVRAWERLCAIYDVINSIVRITWFMLVIMYRYPNASRSAAMITYKALLLSYQCELWSLSGLCGFGKQDDAPKPAPVKEVQKEMEASLRAPQKNQCELWSLSRLCGFGKQEDVPKPAPVKEVQKEEVSLSAPPKSTANAVKNSELSRIAPVEQPSKRRKKTI